VGGARAGVVGVGRGPRRHGRRRWGSEGGGGGGSVEEGRGGRRVGEWEGRRQEAKESGIAFGDLLYKANTISSIHPLMNGLK
jgi:hypothetical protein